MREMKYLSLDILIESLLVPCQIHLYEFGNFMLMLWSCIEQGMLICYSQTHQMSELGILK
jgi:hypothetical protein